MISSKSLYSWGAATLMGAALVTSGSPVVHAQGVANDSFRTAGCTGCFVAQTNAVLATFASIKRAFRVCETGSQVDPNANDGCGVGGADGNFGDFLMIEGTVRDKNNAANMGLGVPGGGVATYRVSANGSGLGFDCTAGNPVGFIAPEGFDGVANTSDDAGSQGVFGAVGPATGAGGNLTVPALSDCDGVLDEFDPANITPMAPAFDPQYEDFCVVNANLGGSDDIDGDRAGVTPLANPAPNPPVQTLQGGPAGYPSDNETTNLALLCDRGFGDLPPGDFKPPRTAGPTSTYGAQVFKIIASQDVHKAGDPSAKLQLADPQIENIFGPSGTQNSSVCAIESLGGESISAAAESGLTACYRNNSSGTRQTFRLTFMENQTGSKSEGSEANSGTCAQAGIGDPFAGTPFKTYVENGGTSNVITCVQNNDNAFGYVDVAREAPLDNGVPVFYSVPVEGVDTDAHTDAELRLLVRCGLYRFWGPLSGGGPGAGAFSAAHDFAMRSPKVFPTGSYVPLEGVAFRKNTTDNAYFMQFHADDCPGAINTPAARPQ